MTYRTHALGLMAILLAGCTSRPAGRDLVGPMAAVQQEDPKSSSVPLRGARHTLEELVDWALRHSDILASQRARIEEKRYAASQARVWPNPTLDFAAGQRRESSSSGLLHQSALVQPLPILGKQGLRGDILELEAKEWRLRQAASEAGVALDVIRLSYEYVVSRHIVDLVEARQQRFELLRSYMAGRVFASPQQQAQARLVEQRLRRLASDALLARARVQASIEQLLAFVDFERGQDPQIEVPWFAGTRVLDEQEQVSRAVAHNPQLALQQVSLKGAELEHKLASREAWPEPSVTAFYGQGKADETERELGGGLSFGLPLGDRNQAGIRSAKRRVLAEGRQRDFQERQLSAQVRELLVEYEAARNRIAQYPRSLPSELATQLAETEEEFRKGRVDLVTFLELDSEFAETATRVFETQLEMSSKVVEILTLVGERSPLMQLGAF